MRHSTASVAGQLEHWSTGCEEIPTSGRYTGNGARRRVGNPEVILLRSVPSRGESAPHLIRSSLGMPKSTCQTIFRAFYRAPSRSLRTDRPTEGPTDHLL